jgi:acyl-coenzyme A thioesterase PaaI-like protein
MNERPSMDAPIDDGYCFACGPENPIGMHVHFERDGDVGVIARTVIAKEFQGWRGIAHGGIALALLDEGMAHAAAAAGHRGVTASVNARFRKPVPLGREIVIRGEVGERRRNVLFVRATVADADGTILLEGEGKFVSRGPLGAVADRRNPSSEK